MEGTSLSILGLTSPVNKARKSGTTGEDSGGGDSQSDTGGKFRGQRGSRRQISCNIFKSLQAFLACALRSASFSPMEPPMFYTLHVLGVTDGLCFDHAFFL